MKDTNHFYSAGRSRQAHDRQTHDRVEGLLDVHRDGFGFVRTTAAPGTDVFIPRGELHGAMQGDRVVVEIAALRPDGRRSGWIVRVLGRSNPTVVGVFHYAHDKRAPGHTVIPWDDRLIQPILIRPGMERGALRLDHSRDRTFTEIADEQAPSANLDSGDADLEGCVVEVEITGWPNDVRGPEGRVIEILGEEDDFGVDVEIVIRKHHLPHHFPADVLDEAVAAASTKMEEAPDGTLREDFRGLPIFTIDGETAKDFDDAVLVRHVSSGWELQVHIADVSSYVIAGSALDDEARLRGTSVYFPDRAVPMLPQELSSGICSLRPGEDRRVLSCVMRLDEQGAIESYRLTEGIIRSAQRMTYTQVHAILEGDAGMRRQFAPLVEEFERMHELARLLHAKRQQRGSIDFDLPEPVIEFDELGAMQNIVRAERSWANRLIEEFMLAANECVADWMEQAGVPALYRIHEKPEARRVVEFEQIAAVFGYSLGLGALPVRRMTMKADRRESRRHKDASPREYEIPEDIAVTPAMYQRLALKIAGKPEERILAHLMLRSLRQARYSEKNEGHFALAARCYTHFTSPIRRYPDLVVHRIVKTLLHSGVSAEAVPAGDGDPRTARGHHRDGPYSHSELAEIALETSQAERRADDAEHELIEWKKLKFMRDRVGEEFDAMILSVTRFGCFVELDDLFIEGLVPIASLEGDYFLYHENTHQIIGERTRRRYSLGDRVRVLLDSVDAVERHLRFSMVEPAAAASSDGAGGGAGAGTRRKWSRKKLKAGSLAKRAPARKKLKHRPKKKRRR